MMRPSGCARGKACPILHFHRLKLSRTGCAHSARGPGFIERAIKLTASPESAGLANLVQLGELLRARKSCQRCLTASFRLAS